MAMIVPAISAHFFIYLPGLPHHNRRHPDPDVLIFAILVIFLLTDFLWLSEIAPVMGGRIANKSFLNPYDPDSLRDFNLFALVVTIMNLIVNLIVPGTVAVISTVWFSIGGIIDLRRMFRDLAARVDNPLDDGRVNGHVSLADAAVFQAHEKAIQSEEPRKRY